MNLTFKEYLQERSNSQHDQYTDAVMQIMGVTALSPNDRDVVQQGMQQGLSPEDVAGQLLNPEGSDLPPPLDQDPEGMATAGGPGF